MTASGPDPGAPGGAPTAEDVRALARSSPWLWRTLRFTLRTPTTEPYGIDRLRAWVSRPHGLRAEQLDGRLITAGWGPPADQGMPEITGGPQLRPDGLVARRPADWIGPFRFDDPMLTTYRWVAMVHPFELADGVERDEDGLPGGDWSPDRPPIVVIDGPRVVEHAGRLAWEAEVVTTAAYAARCSCCPVLDGSEATAQLIREGWERGDLGRPSSWRIRLDRQTGVLVQLTEIGGSSRSGGWTMTIEAVDEPMPRELFGPEPAGGTGPVGLLGADP
ncbi:hypothetical protein [Nakamurella sp.]|uniref:hypothetical protein n=1 Tax=Nakamurella sp. TaxID=1869182 RepID=UPI003B3B1DE6